MENAYTKITFIAGIKLDQAHTCRHCVLLNNAWRLFLSWQSNCCINFISKPLHTCGMFWYISLSIYDNIHTYPICYNTNTYGITHRIECSAMCELPRCYLLLDSISEKHHILLHIKSIVCRCMLNSFKN